jgi:hypothetical protein
MSDIYVGRCRFVYVENSSNVSSYKPILTGVFHTLDEIKKHVANIIPSHPNIIIEYYNKKSGVVNRRKLEDGESLAGDLENIYIYLRSKQHMSCHVCLCENHRHK